MPHEWLIKTHLHKPTFLVKTSSLHVKSLQPGLKSHIPVVKMESAWQPQDRVWKCKEDLKREREENLHQIWIVSSKASKIEWKTVHRHVLMMASWKKKRHVAILCWMNFLLSLFLSMGAFKTWLGPFGGREGTVADIYLEVHYCLPKNGVR